jgi:signal transduction histidine kinase
MDSPGFLLWPAAALGLVLAPARAQSPADWRHFTGADGFPEPACLSVTPALNGDVLVRHPRTNVVSIFDGFDVTQVPGPDANRSRVFASPGGQLWTVVSTGLAEFRDTNWTLVPVAAVAEHFRAGPPQEVRLLPVRQGRVLVLLPTELLQLTKEASEPARVDVLLRVEPTGLGGFTNLLPARNGTLLIAGKSGFAQSEQTFRALSPEGRWETTRLPPPEVAEGEPSRMGPPGAPVVMDRVNLPGGIVWLATSNGLSRYAPPLWRHRSSRVAAPPAAGYSAAQSRFIEAARPQGPWNVIFKTRAGDLWFGGENQVGYARGESFEVFASTNQIGPEQVRAFAETYDGRIICATPTKIWEFDGQTWVMLRGGFTQVNALLHARNGTLWVAAADGVHRFTRGAWVLNDSADGLPAVAITNVIEDPAGGIIARTAAGDWAYDPAADSESPRAFIPPTSDPRAEFREGETLIVEFTGRDRWDVTAPDRLLFSTKLAEREWSAFEYATEKILADLPVGRHLFQVRAMDRNANISAPATLEFTVVLPWYRENRLVVVLASALIVALAFAGLAYNRHRKLQLAYATVERQVAERTRELELAQRELVHSQKMNALGTLAAGIAHDFNNILSIVKGSAQIIEDNPENPEKIRTRVDRIKTVVQQGAGIVEAMLGFSRQSSGAVARQDVNAIVEETIKLLGDRFLRGVDVKFDPGPNLPQIAVVRDFVQQALLNFIFNAAEAMERRAGSEPAGDARSQIDLATRLGVALPSGLFLKPAPAPAFVHLSVRDTGEGITPENLPRIFEPFFTTKAMSSQRGTGLGLSMVYELARKLEAGLAVESEPGKGSTFTLIIPVRTP